MAPLPPALFTSIFAMLTPLELRIEIPSPVLPAIVPPEPAVVPAPVTVKLPVAPLSMMPFVPPVELTLCSVTASGELVTSTPSPAWAVTVPPVIVSGAVKPETLIPGPLVASTAIWPNVVAPLLPVATMPPVVVPLIVVVPDALKGAVLFARLMPAPLVAGMFSVPKVIAPLLPVALIPATVEPADRLRSRIGECARVVHQIDARGGAGDRRARHGDIGAADFEY